MLTVDSHPE